MFGYRFGPLGLVTATRLPELPPWAPGRRDVWQFRLSRAAAPERPRWFQEWAFPDGRPWAAFGSLPDGWVARFARTATFRVHPARRRIVARPHAGIPVRTVRHLLLDQVLPLVISNGSHLVLHASAVEMHGYAVAFAGVSGSGKSTVAAACALRGHALLSDDCFVVDVDARPVAAIPACSGLRLWPDALGALFADGNAGAAVAHYTRKRRVTDVVPHRAPRLQPLPVRVLCVLERARAGTIPVLTRLRGQQAFRALLRCTFQLDNRDRAAALALHRVAALLDRVPAYRLTLPRSFARLKHIPDLVASIEPG